MSKWWKKVWCSIARPRRISLGGNSEVQLKNIDPALADKITEVINAAVAAPAQEVVQDEEEAILSHVALGTYQESGNWYVATLNFDPKSGQAKVVGHEKVGPAKQEAAERFKIAAVSQKVV